MDKIIALVSGLDSFCYLGQYISKYKIEVLIFNYGQRSQQGVEQTTYLINSLTEKHSFLIRRTIQLQALKFLYPKSQQINKYGLIEPIYQPKVVLSLRNTIFLTIAIAYAKTVGAKKVIIGATTDDASPYLELPKFPDLNSSYLLNLEKLLDIGCPPWAPGPVEIWSPARSGMSKAKNLRNGFEIFGDLIFQTWSCYLGDADLGGERQCGRCYGCVRRKEVFEQARIEDKTKYEI